MKPHPIEHSSTTGFFRAELAHLLDYQHPPIKVVQ